MNICEVEPELSILDAVARQAPRQLHLDAKRFAIKTALSDGDYEGALRWIEAYRVCLLDPDLSSPTANHAKSALGAIERAIRSEV